MFNEPSFVKLVSSLLILAPADLGFGISGSITVKPEIVVYICCCVLWSHVKSGIYCTWTRTLHKLMLGKCKKAKSAYEQNSPSGQGLSRFVLHEATWECLYSPLAGMLVYHRVTPSITCMFAGSNLYTRVERGTVRVKTTECPWSGFELRLLNPEASTLTTRSSCLPHAG